MKNFVQPGDVSVPLPMPYRRVTSGQGVLVGALFGVVAVDALDRRHRRGRGERRLRHHQGGRRW